MRRRRNPTSPSPSSPRTQRLGFLVPSSQIPGPGALLPGLTLTKKAENGQAIGAPGGGTEVPIEFLVEVDELHLGGSTEIRVLGRRAQSGQWETALGFQVRLRIEYSARWVGGRQAVDSMEKDGMRHERRVTSS